MRGLAQPFDAEECRDSLLQKRVLHLRWHSRKLGGLRGTWSTSTKAAEEAAGDMAQERVEAIKRNLPKALEDYELAGCNAPRALFSW